MFIRFERSESVVAPVTVASAVTIEVRGSWVQLTHDALRIPEDGLTIAYYDRGNWYLQKPDQQMKFALPQIDGIYSRHHLYPFTDIVIADSDTSLKEGEEYATV